MKKAAKRILMRFSDVGDQPTSSIPIWCGLDYYNHTIFEFITEIEGNELTVCAGGRYEWFGISVALRQLVLIWIGVERILLVLEKKGIELPIETGLDAYIAVLGDEPMKALSLVQALRTKVSRQNVTILDVSSRHNLSQQMSLRQNLDYLRKQ